MAAALARRLIEPGVTYLTRSGFGLQIDPQDAFQPLMLVGLFDRWLDYVLTRFARPGSVAIDAGAHVGYVSLLLARRVGPSGCVEAFECDARMLARAEANLAANGFAWVRLNPLAVLDRSAPEVPLHVTSQQGWSSVVGGVWETESTVPVPAVSIDEHLAGQNLSPREVSVVKLDVEGAEPAALRGMAHTLRHGSPAVIVEFIPWRLRAAGEDPEALLSYMAQHGYRPWSARRKRWSFELVAGAEPDVGEDVVFLKG